MMTRLKTFAAFASIAAMLITALPAQAYAGGYGHGYKHGYGYGHGYKYGYRHGYRGKKFGYGYRHGYRHGYRRGHYYHRNRNDWVPFAVLGGLATALIITSANSNKRSRSTYYDAPQRATRPCHTVHRIEEHSGERVKMGATMCYDTNSIPYIVDGSQHVVEYVR